MVSFASSFNTLVDETPCCLELVEFKVCDPVPCDYFPKLGYDALCDSGHLTSVPLCKVFEHVEAAVMRVLLLRRCDVLDGEVADLDL